MCLTDCAAAGVMPEAAARARTANQILMRMCGSWLKLRRRLRRRSPRGHHGLVKLFHLCPCGRNGAFLPAAVSADGRATDEDPIVWFVQHSEPARGAAAA